MTEKPTPQLNSEEKDEQVFSLIIEELRKHRNNYADQIPPELQYSKNSEHTESGETGVLQGTQGSPEEGTSKARKNWWQRVLGYIELMDMNYENRLDEDLKTECTNFLRTYQSVAFQQQTLVTEDDIKEANRVLDLILHKFSPTS